MNLSSNRLYHLQGYKIGASIGLVIGLAVFINLPTIGGVIAKTVIFTLLGASIGHIFDKPGLKSLTLSIVLIVPATVVTGFVPPQCTLELYIHEPTENPLTGEVQTGDYEGYRLEACDKGRHPWYYQQTSQEKITEYCNNNPNTSYCDKMELPVYN